MSNGALRVRENLALHLTDRFAPWAVEVGFKQLEAQHAEKPARRDISSGGSKSIGNCLADVSYAVLRTLYGRPHGRTALPLLSVISRPPRAFRFGKKIRFYSIRQFDKTDACTLTVTTYDYFLIVLIIVMF